MANNNRLLNLALRPQCVAETQGRFKEGGIECDGLPVGCYRLREFSFVLQNIARIDIACGIFRADGNALPVLDNRIFASRRIDGREPLAFSFIDFVAHPLILGKFGKTSKVNGGVGCANYPQEM